MNPTRAFKRSAIAAVTLAAAAYAAADFSVGVLLIGLPLLLLGWRLTEGPRPVVLPRWTITALLLVVIGWTAFDALTAGFRVGGFCRFLLLVVLVKTWDRKSPSDHAQILTLSTFLAIGAVLTSNTLPVGLLVFGTLAALASAAMLFQLHAGVARHGAGATPACGPRAGRQLRGLTLAVIVLGNLASVVVFLVMPRGIGENLFGAWGHVGVGRVTGFADRVELGRAGLISESSRAVLDLHVADAFGAPMGAETETFYLRGAVLDRYDQTRRTWYPGSDEREGIRAIGGSPVEFGQIGGARIVQTIAVRASAPGLTPLFALWRPVSVKIAGVDEVLLAPSDGTMLAEARQPAFTYEVVSVIRDSRPGPPGERSPAFFQIESVRDLAGRIARDAGLEPDPAARGIDDDLRLGQVLEAYFRRGFEYTLDTLAAPPGRDPIEWFLTDGKRGHCEYFAAAHAALCRGVGIPSRVVTGYAASEFDAGRGKYVVRESDAHAWTEVEIRPGVWRTFDPTPPAALTEIRRQRRGLFERISIAMSDLNDAWNLSIAGFDRGTRDRVLGLRPLSSGWLDGRLSALSRELARGGIARFKRALVNGVLAGVCVAGAAVLLSLGWPHLARARGRRAPAGAQLPPGERGAYRRMLRALDQAGMSKPPWRPPLEHADAIAAEPGAAEAVRSVAAMYYAARFGGRPSSPGAIATAEGAIRSLRLLRRRSRTWSRAADKADRPIPSVR